MRNGNHNGNGRSWNLYCEDCRYGVSVAENAPRGGEAAADIMDEHMQAAHGKRFPKWREDVAGERRGA